MYETPYVRIIGAVVRRAISMIGFSLVSTCSWKTGYQEIWTKDRAIVRITVDDGIRVRLFLGG